MDSTTGKAISGLTHLRQSLKDILSTRIGTRVMRRDYGSNLPNRIDAPLNPDTIVELYADTAEAIQKWEPRFDLQSVSISSASPGKVVLKLVGIYLPDGREVTMDGIEVTA